MSEPVLLVEKSEGIATVTLNRPAVMNALSIELRDSLRHAFIDLNSDPETEVVIITGAGRAFCSGLDLKELSTQGIGVDDATDIASSEGFFFNYPIGLDKWSFHVRTPVVEPKYELIDTLDIYFELADRVGVKKEYNLFLENYFSGKKSTWEQDDVISEDYILSLISCYFVICIH